MSTFDALKEVAAMFRDVLIGDPALTAYERAQKETRRRAREQAEAEYHRIMANFYTERVLSIDPQKDWWAFAEAKQKQYDHQNDCLRYERRAGSTTPPTDTKL